MSNKKWLQAICIALCFSGGISLAAESADLDREVQFNIPPQRLSDAVVVFSDQSGVQVVTAGEDLTRLSTAGVSGKLAIAAGLAKLLEGTALRFETVGDSTVAVMKARMAQAEAAAVNSAIEGSEQRQQGTSEENQGRDSLEEIVVTAQKRVERLTDVPISISVLSGAHLDQSTAQSVNDVLSNVPGVSVIGASQAGGSVVTVRGVAPSSTFFGGSNTVSYYLDSVPFNLVNSAIAPDANAYDMERVEVLRGPQGTLYGASALNGVVRVLTKDADLDAFELKARTSGSSTKSGGPSYRGDLAVNVPMIEGKLGARGVVGYQNLGGWVDKVSGEKDVNDGELLNLRLKLNAKPSENLSIGFSTWVSRQDFGAPPTIANREGQTRAGVDEPLSIEYEVHGLRIAYDFPAFSIASSTGYLNYETRDTIDFCIGLFNTFSCPLNDRFDIDVVSEELNLTSTSDGPWRWTAGAIYRDGKNRTSQILPGIVTLDWTDTSTSYAVFGELTRRFWDEALEFTAGARYFHDEVTTKENPAATGAVPNYREQATFEATTPRAVLTWFPKENFTLYGSYSEGFRSGSPQAYYVTGGLSGVPPVKPDRLNNYEIGTKVELMDRRLSVEAALYYIDWQDVQHYITVPFGINQVAAVVNGDSASGLGFDLGVIAHPFDGLELGVSFNTNDLAVDSEVLSNNVVLFSRGDRLNFSPEYTIGASASYLFPLGGSGIKGQLAASLTHTSEQTNRAIGQAGEFLLAEGDRMSIGRVSFSIRSPKRWETMIFADNITNEEGEYYHGATFTAPDAEGNRVRPRTVGLQLEYQW